MGRQVRHGPHAKLGGPSARSEVEALMQTKVGHVAWVVNGLRRVGLVAYGDPCARSGSILAFECFADLVGDAATLQGFRQP